MGIKTFSGEGGIRTLGSRKGYNGFRDRPDRPLWHLSDWQASIILEMNRENKHLAAAGQVYSSKVSSLSGKRTGGIPLI